MKIKKSIHIFRRDLRLSDNTALINNLKLSEQVIPAFIFDSRQISKDNAYRGEKLIRFMLNCLDDLNSQLKEHGSQLYLFYGKSEEVLEQLIQQEKIDLVSINCDYTPFALKRDQALKELCSKHNVKFFAEHDALLHKPGDVLKNDGDPYTVFTPFYKKAIQTLPAKPKKLINDNFYNAKISQAINDYPEEIGKLKFPKLAVQGGRSEALKIKKKLKSYENYKEQRDFPALDSTSKLSAHNKFGTISVREIFWEIEKHFNIQHTLIQELYWRDFFTQINLFFPHVYGQSFNPKYKSIKWSKSKQNFEKWCTGNTGFPIVDAGMRELVETGYMHNRVRMITASFLVKDLQLNWQWGEKYFAQHLLDYDPAVNNGNWQWAASTGCDAQPYFRIFNPWLQQKKFDENCEYIKKWVPELQKVEAKILHDVEKLEKTDIAGYPKPMVDHFEAKEKTLKLFKAE